MTKKNFVKRNEAKKKLNLQPEINSIMEAYDIFTQSYINNSKDALKLGKTLTIIQQFPSTSETQQQCSFLKYFS